MVRRQSPGAAATSDGTGATRSTAGGDDGGGGAGAGAGATTGRAVHAARTAGREMIASSFTDLV